MNVLVVGAGATGGLVGTRLAAAGRDVTFLVREARAQVLERRGLRLVTPDGEHTIAPRLRLAGEIAAPYDVVVLAVKGTALQRAVVDMAPAVGPETVIVPLLNGIGHLDLLNDRFGAGSVLGGVVKVVVDLDADGDVVQLAPMATIVVGEQDGELTARLDAVRRLFEDGGFDATASSGVIADMWDKWVFISTVGAMTSLMRGSVGDVVAAPDGVALGPALLAEAARIAAASGFPTSAVTLAETTAVVTAEGSRFASSLYRDLVAGRPTEVEHVLGDLVARAERLGVDAPRLSLATLALRVYEMTR
jgi:2-dehydropantoate 2-reductase